MPDWTPDVIIIGGGMAGLCCAGELVLQGAEPLLISEAKEVGAALRSQMVEGNRGVVQLPTWQVGWGGGWWPSLVKRLNIPVRVPKGFGPVDYVPRILGLDTPGHFPQCSLSGSTLADTLVELFPPLAGLKEEFNRILHAALSIPYETLVRMHNVLLVDWLEDQKTDEMVAHFMVTLGSLVTVTTADFCRDHVSVFGAVGFMRSFFCGDAVFGAVEPDVREGLAIPLAREIERRGGTIWRGRRVAEVNVEGGRVRTVVMQDGTEAQAPLVALACGAERIAQLLSPSPPDIEAPLAYSARIAHQDFNVFAVLDQPVIPDAIRAVGVMTIEGNLVQWECALHTVVPWLAQPGKQFYVCGTALRPEQVAEQGGEEAVLAGMLKVAEDQYPGFKEATGAVGNFAHKPGHLWYGQSTAGPKLPRRSTSVDGLWYLSEATEPAGGCWMEHSASNAILAARAMTPT